MDHTARAISLFNKHAGLYADKYMNVDNYKSGLDFFCDHLTSDTARILDIACGPGNITNYLLQKLPGLKITGIDMADNMLEQARTQNPTSDFIKLDARNIRSLEVVFNAITCGFGLPYLPKEDAVKLIKDISCIIDSGGLLYLSTIEGSYTNSEYKTGSTGEKLFTYYYESEYLKIILEENGLKIIFEQQIDLSENINNNELVLIAIKM